MKNVRLEKFKVCQDCYSVGIIVNDCICTYSHKYPTIELEFEVCNCCGNLTSDGDPAESDFNNKQFKKLEEDESSIR